MKNLLGAADARRYRRGRIAGKVAAIMFAPLLALACASLPAAAEIRIAAFGDSLTQGFGLPEEEGFVPQLEDWLHTNGADDVTVINAGVSGDTTAGGRARVEWMLADEPDAVIVALGGNDLLRGIDPATTRENLDAILAATDERGLPVLLAGLPAPANYGSDYKEAFDAIFPDLAAEYDAILHPNFLGGIGDRLVEGRAREMMQEDGIHPNAAGVEAVVEAIGPVVLELVQRAREDSTASGVTSGRNSR